MAAALAPRRLPAWRPFGRPDGLRACATLALAVSGTALSLGATRNFLSLDASRSLVWAYVLAAIAGSVGVLLLRAAAAASRSIERGETLPGLRRGWALLMILSGLGVLGLLPLRAWTLGRRGHWYLDWDVPVDTMAGAALVAVGATLAALGFEALRDSRWRGVIAWRTGRVPHGESATAAGSSIRTLVPAGRLSPTTFGWTEALLAFAVAILAVMVDLVGLSHKEPFWRATSGTLSVTDPSLAIGTLTDAEPWPPGPSPCEKTVALLFLVQVATLALVWRGRRPRLVVRPPEVVRWGPALFTACVGVGLLALVVSLWRLLASISISWEFDEEAPLLASGVLGLVLLAVGGSSLRVRSPRHVQAPPVEPEPVVELAQEPLLANAFVPPSPSAHVRPTAPLALSQPAGYSSSRAPDTRLTPSTPGLLLLTFLSLAFGLPAFIYFISETFRAWGWGQ